jgi:hypothetical protein
LHQLYLADTVSNQRAQVDARLVNSSRKLDLQEGKVNNLMPSLGSWGHQQGVLRVLSTKILTLAPQTTRV